MLNRSTTTESSLRPPSPPKASPTYAPVYNVEIRHELGCRPEDSMETRDIVVRPSEYPSLVRVMSRTVAGPAQKLGSPEYLAAIRRRRVAAIRELVADLVSHATREDLAVCTFPIVESIRSLLDKLDDAEAEGNTREILRQLRDTFLDGGWHQYRRPDAREAAVTVLRQLESREPIEPDDVTRAFDVLWKLQKHSLATFPGIGDEDEIPH